MTRPLNDRRQIHDFRSRSRCRGFTILELMIVIAILFLLVGIALVAVRGVKKNADRLQSTNALKQMMSAYISYSTEHKGRLMPGYVDPSEIWTDPTSPTPPGQMLLQAKLQTGHVLSADDTASYVWRLSPYLAHNWQVMFTDYRSPSIMTLTESEYGAGDASGTYGPDGAAATDFAICSYPSFGLNSIFLGGDSTHGPHPELAPWKVPSGMKPLAITRLSDAKSPAKVVVFAPSQSPPLGFPTPIQADDVTQTSRRGFVELRAPMANNYTDVNNTIIPEEWWLDPDVTHDGRIMTAGTQPMGVPVDRLGDDKIAIGHLDGSTTNEILGRLAKDMSMWDPRKVSPN